jgi:acetolactate synthase-1/2/3 large subunit
MAGSEWLLRYLKADTLWSEQPAYDALLVIGSGLAQWATAGFDPALAPDGPMYQVDCDAAVFGRAYPNTTGIQGDASLALQRLIQLSANLEPTLFAEERGTFVKQTVKAVPAWLEAEARASQAHPILPQRVMAELQHTLDAPWALARGVNIFCDIGNSTGWVWHHLQIRPPHRAFFNTTMGSMGWASGAVLGGKLGDPNRFALAISGDGAFFMNGSEISTALQCRIPAVWLVLQDDNMAMVTHGMSATHQNPPSASGWASHYALGDSDLVAFAAGLGADAYAASAAGDVIELLPGLMRAAEMRRKPQVLVVRIDALATPPYPHLRPPTRA